MSPKNIIIASGKRAKSMDNNPIINPETITAKLSDGEPVISEEQAQAYQNTVDDLANKYEEARQNAEDVLWLSEPVVVERPTPLTKYEIQESKRAPKIQVDQRVILLSWIIAVGIAFVSSAIVSFNGITAVAQFVGLSASWMAGLFFFFIELMYLIFLVAYLVLASRVDENGEPERTGGALWGMISFASIAVAANAFHTLDFWNWDLTNPQMWAGVVLSIAAPIAIISASKMASRVVFARAIKLA